VTVMRTAMTAAALAAYLHLGAAPVANADPAMAADPLILSVEDVRGIAGYADLAPAAPVDRPGGQHQYDAQYPSDCHAMFNQDVAFAGGFSQFRSVSYAGPANRTVTQAVAVYPDSDAARAALTRLGKSLNACSELAVPNMAITAQVLDRTTFAVCQAQCSTLYRAAGPVLIGVDAVRFGDSDRIATAVLQQITGRVKAA
jgi:hypothetical protein